MEELFTGCASLIVRIREADQAELDDIEGDIWLEIEILADQVEGQLDYPISSAVNGGLEARLPLWDETATPRSPLSRHLPDRR